MVPVAIINCSPLAENRTLSPVFLTLRASSVLLRKTEYGLGHRYESTNNVKRKKERDCVRSFFRLELDGFEPVVPVAITNCSPLAKNRTLSPVFLTLRASSVLLRKTETDSATGPNQVTDCIKKETTCVVSFFMELLTGFEPVAPVAIINCSPLAKNRTFSSVFLTLRASSVLLRKTETDSVTGTNRRTTLNEKRNGTVSVPFSFGAANRIRTGDLVLTKDVLYLLSHSSM